MGEYLRMSHICSDNEQIHFLTEPEKLHGWVFVWVRLIKFIAHLTREQLFCDNKCLQMSRRKTAACFSLHHNFSCASFPKIRTNLLSLRQLWYTAAVS